jgi:hypothetical protein
MEDNEIYKELNDYDNGRKNKYEEHWGTLLNFLDESKLDEATISRLNKTEEEDNNSFLQNHDLLDELHESAKPKNMNDLYDKLSNVPERTNASVTKDVQSPDMNYVYQSKKKAVVMVRKKAGTQMNKHMHESSFYSQQEKPTNASAASNTGFENFNIGYKAIAGTPAPKAGHKISVSHQRPNMARK